MNSMFISFCEFFVVLENDEMNCNLVSGFFFTMYFEVQILVI